MDQETVKLKIDGMTCQGCADTVSRYLAREPGVLKVAIRWRSGAGDVTFDPAVTSGDKIVRSAVFQGHYSAEIA